MILHTGGCAVGAISTKSRDCSRAFFSASNGCMIPNCSPSSPMTRISRARIRSFIRVNLSAIRRLLLEPGNPCDYNTWPVLLDTYLAAIEVQGHGQELPDGLGALVAVLAMPHADRAGLRLAIADHQHIRHLLKLVLADLGVDLL